MEATGLKAECVRLRTDERLSLGEIQKKTGAAKGSLSVWLRPHPLSGDEIRLKRSKPRPGHKRTSRGEESKFHKVAPLRSLSKPQKARLAEIAVLFRLCALDVDVFRSSFDGSKFDFLVHIRKADRIAKIQVKAVREPKKHGLPIIPLWCSAGRGSYRRYDKGEFDVVVGYDYYTDTAYVYSWDEVADLKSAVTVREDAAERWDKL